MRLRLFLALVLTLVGRALPVRVGPSRGQAARRLRRRDRRRASTTATFTLANGLEVILSEDKRLPMVAVNLWYPRRPRQRERRAAPASRTCSST